MSRWFALSRTSSSNGKSHSNRTITVCTSLKTLVTFSKPIIQPMSSSSMASRNGWVLVRLSILSTVSTAILLLSLNASVPTRIQWFLKPHIQLLLDKLSESLLSKHRTRVSRTYSQPQSIAQINLHTSLCLFAGKLSEFSLVQTPHLCLQDSLPTSACRDILNVHLQAGCRSLHLSKHLTCVSRTYSQPQPVEITSSTQNMLLQAMN